MLQVLAAAAIGAAAMVPNLLPPDPVPEPPAAATAPAPATNAELIRVTVQATDAQGRPVVSVPLTSGRIAWLDRLAIG